MEPSPALSIWSEILAPPFGVALVVLVGALTVRHFSPTAITQIRWGLVSVSAIAQLFVYLGGFLVSFGFGDAGTQVPWWLSAVTLVLGFPLMYVLYLLPVLGLGRAVLGDGVVLLSVLSSVNAVVWGLAVDYLAKRRGNLNAV